MTVREGTGWSWKVKALLRKYRNKRAFQEGNHYEERVVEGNLLLNEGIQLLEDLLIGAGGTAYNNANARIGVGNSSTAAVATQTGLQGASSQYKGMDATFPSRSSQTVSFQATFGATEGNFAWEEWTIENGAAALVNLNRKVSSLG